MSTKIQIGRNKKGKRIPKKNLETTPIEIDKKNFPLMIAKL